MNSNQVQLLESEVFLQVHIFQSMFQEPKESLIISFHPPGPTEPARGHWSTLEEEFHTT